jgi:uncharacterized low-complexity protein
MILLRASACAAVLALTAPAQAQHYGSPYAVEVAPGTYVIHGSDGERNYPYVRCGADCAARDYAPRAAGRQSIPIEQKLDVDRPKGSGPAATDIAREGANEDRVIHAEAEVTILGPDRMSIRLFRKPSGKPKPHAEADD